MAGRFNVIDFMDLPSVERCLVRLVLRETSLSYSELQEAVKTLPPDLQMDQLAFDSALDHLTLSDWLVQQTSDQKTVYRVNTQDKTANPSQGLIEGPDLAQMDEAISPRLNLEPSDRLSNNRGKRVLPNHIWDCLTEPTEPAAAEPPAPEAPKRRTSLFDKFIDEDNTAKKA